MSRSAPLFIALTLTAAFGAFTPSASAQTDFLRGDADQDGVAGTVSDANYIFRALSPIVGPPPPFVSCVDSADVDDNGTWNVADGVHLLLSISGSEVIPPPFQSCGPDPTVDGLECGSFNCTQAPLPQIPTATLRLESEFGAIGDFLTVRLLVDSTGPASQLPVGFATSIDHDPSVATIVSIEFSDDWDGFEHSLIETGRCSLAALNLFGQALPNSIATITYELIGSGTSPLTFGDLPLRTEVAVQSGFGGFPLLIEGAIGVKEFKRGDANDDSSVDIGDAITVLGTLFLGNPASPCVDAADANDDGAIDLGDPITILNFIIGGGALPPAPGPFNCGPDPTADALRCQETTCP